MEPLLIRTMMHRILTLEELQDRSVLEDLILGTLVGPIEDFMFYFTPFPMVTLTEEIVRRLQYL